MVPRYRARIDFQHDHIDVVTFGFALTVGRTVTVDANRNIQGINFTNTSGFGYTLSSGNLLLTNGGTIQTRGAGTAHTDTINTAIEIQGDGGAASFTVGSTVNTRLLVIGGGITGVSSGSNVTTLTLNGANTGANAVNGNIGNGGKFALVKSGAGSWTLGSASNSYSGGTAINGGTLIVSADDNLGNTSGCISFNGGTLQMTVSSARSIAMTGAGAMNMNIAFTPIFSSPVTGSGALTLNHVGRRSSPSPPVCSASAVTFVAVGNSAPSKPEP